MARTTKKIAITASVDDKASGPMLKISQSAQQAAVEQAATEAKLTKFVKERQATLEKFLPSAKKVTLEMQKQVAGADPLLQRLAKLQKERALLTSSLNSQAKESKVLDAEELKMVATSQKSIDAVKKEIRARNKLTTATKRGGSQFSKLIQSVQANNVAMARQRTATAGLSKETERLPDKFGKAAAALNLFSSANSKNSGIVADAGAKIADLASLAVVGGPFGVAFAGATGLVLGLTAAFEAFNADAKLYADGLKRITEETTKMKTATAEMTDELDRQELEVSFGVDRFVTDQKRKQEALLNLNGANNAAIATTAALIAMENEGTTAGRKEIATLNGIRDALMAQNAAREPDLQLIAKAIDLHEIKKQNAAEEAEANKKEAESHRRRADAAVNEAKRILAARLEAEKILALERKMIIDKRFRDVSEHYADQEQLARDFNATIKEIEEAAEKDRFEREKAAAAASKTLAAESLAAERQLQAERMASGMFVANTLTNATAEMFADMTDGSKTAGEAFEGMTQAILQAAAQETMRILTLKAVEAAVSAYAGNVGVPVVGPILAAAAATAAFGAVTAWGANMAEGGVITGGIEGQDSVRITAMPGEEVIKTRTARDFKREHGQTIGQALEGGGVGGGNTTIYQQHAAPSFVFSSVVPSDARQRRHIARTVNRELMRARAMGAAI